MLPYTTKRLMDDVVLQHNWDLLPKLAMWVGTATVVDAACSFANSQILGVAAQRAITDMRKDIEAHVMLCLPGSATSISIRRRAAF